FDQLWSAVNGFGHLLKKEGFTPGDKLAIWSWNNLSYVVAVLSVWSLGGIVIPLDEGTKPEGVIQFLNHAEAKFLLTAPRGKSTLNLIRQQTPSLKTIFSLEDPLKSFSQTHLDFKTDKTTPAAIIYTSGTTGSPKGIVLTYHHLDSPVMTLNHFGYLSPQDVYLALAPFSHLGGLVGILIAFASAGTLVLMERFIPNLFLKYIHQHKVTGFFCPPTVLQSLLLQEDVDSNMLQSVRWLASFGAPCPPAVIRAFSERYPWIDFVTGYGLTESSAPNVLMPLGIPLEKKLEPGIVGQPAPWVEVKVVNEAGESLPSGHIGEILLKGWFIMSGYYKEPELTQKVIKDDWLYTGDLGYIDESGFLHITGRKKEVIIVGGLNVYANEVEFILQEHPAVAEVAVVGVPDGIRGEVVKAVIVPKTDVSVQEIINFCRKKLAPYKVPRVVEFRQFLPKTTSGKVRKADLVS
ncbi:MAG: acyl--CoA ligase, partial [Candidatus Desulfofervidaceae bacterium]|nr:acyl--CoA ligase [Candidatus Desulfofervidaceae bacterium]